MRKFIIAFAILFLLPDVCFAHAGGTDINGGHRNENGWYHYHHGYSEHDHYHDICPYYVAEMAYDTSYPWEYEAFLYEYVDGFECGYDIGSWDGEEDGYDEYHKTGNFFNCEQEYDAADYDLDSPYSYGYSDGYRTGYCIYFEESYNNEASWNDDDSRYESWEIEEVKLFATYKTIDTQQPLPEGQEESDQENSFFKAWSYGSVIFSVGALIFGAYWFFRS